MDLLIKLILKNKKLKATSVYKFQNNTFLNGKLENYTTPTWLRVCGFL